MTLVRVLVSVLIGILNVSPGLAQEASSQEGDESLAQQARNPTAALTMMQVVMRHNPSFHNLEGADQTSMVVMPIIPFRTGNLQHIARVTLPFVLAGPDWGTLLDDEQANALPPNYVPTADKAGIADMAVFDFLLFPAPWQGGQLAAGVSGILPTASDPALGTEKWSVGPAVAALHQAGKLLVGAIALANFSVAGAADRDDVRSLTLQPFGSYGLGGNWSLELSEMNYGYDFNSKTWTSLPLGGRLGVLTNIGTLPVRFYGDVEYNFADSGVAPDWTFRFAVVPLI